MLGWCIFGVVLVNLVDVEKLGIVLHLEVKRHGRRTYVNLPDTEVKSCRIEPNDVLLIKLLEIQRVVEKDE